MFYDKYAQLCKQRGISNSAAAVEAGLSRSLVTKWKTNKVETPSPEVLEKLSAYFGIPISELLGEEEMGIKKEQPVEINGLSDELVELIGVLKELPKDKILALLQLAKSMK